MRLTDDIVTVYQAYQQKGLILAACIIPALYVMSGFYSVGPEQRAIVTRLGKIVNDNVNPGMHYRLPWPLEEEKKFPAAMLRSMVIDFSEDTAKYRQPELTTGDGNLSDTSIEVQYAVGQPGLFYSTSKETETLLEKIARANTVNIIGATAFDPLLTTERNRFQNKLKYQLQAQADGLSLGLRITSVQIRRLDPPKSIKKAYDNVTVARTEKQKSIQIAKGERSTQLAHARSKANQITVSAQAKAGEVIEIAKGDDERFRTRLASYLNAPNLNDTRLYLANIEKLLGQSKITVVSTGKSNKDININTNGINTNGINTGGIKIGSNHTD
ncbi:FtsH protease activity modulator HflK [Marinibactrum halimedae]|uniref:Protein HflK n=1 Tax=Marinibactrum halimedae TaxID=1444977 RepID=A0AA37TA42_9GAMM|nr:FtsH protease activity modulator HflK [Marinibactrum halimedae]MCD9457423.1 FtsH protease activity modulator HflK [Marinibactrum halimedae]GLS25527.1 hypothetical protein GCM10007877_12410 [Marinibactrum halimedae]